MAIPLLFHRFIICILTPSTGRYRRARLMKNVLDQTKPGQATPNETATKEATFDYIASWLFAMLVAVRPFYCPTAAVVTGLAWWRWMGGSCAPSHDDVYLSRRRNWLIFRNLPSLTHFNPFSSGHTNNDGGPLLSYSSLCVVGYRVLSIHSISLYKNAHNTSSSSVLVDKWRSKNG